MYQLYTVVKMPSDEQCLLQGLALLIKMMKCYSLSKCMRIRISYPTL